MPLRDHFHPPLSEKTSWQEFHGGWPMVIVQSLRKVLPAGYVAGPRLQITGGMEIDVAALETDDNQELPWQQSYDGGVATAVWSPARPTLHVATDLPDLPEYEVRIYDTRKGRLLVAAIELVSPANKDRPEHRQLFIAKCAALLQQHVSVCILDLVTERHSNLYAELLALIHQPNSADPASKSPIYATSTRCLSRVGQKPAILESWSYPLELGQALPTLPLWLSETLAVPLQLETTYEQTCHDLWIS